MSLLKRLPHNPLFDLVLLALFGALFFGASLGNRPYSAPSEARYVEIGREMADSGDYVTPRLNYVKYFEKPPLFYWVQAAVTRIWGVSPFVSRTPTACFALLLCLLTYGLGRMLYGRATGICASLVLITSIYMFALSRVVLVDVPVSFFLVATLTAFLYAANAPQGRARTLVVYLMYAAAACAVLTKGLIGMVLPGAIVFLWLVMTGKWHLLSSMRLVSGTVLFLLIAVPWHLLVAQRNPEFLHFYFIHEHFQRYLTKEARRYQPFWFFAAVLIGGLFPWVTFAPQALTQGLKGFWQQRKENGTPLFLLLWIVFIFMFFSLSDSKLIPYILPIFPPIAALIGYYLAQAWAGDTVLRFRSGLFTLIVLLVGMALAPTVLMQTMNANSKVVVALAQSDSELTMLSVSFLLGAVLLLITYIQGRTRHVILALFVVAVAIVQMGGLVSAHYNRDSMEKFANDIRNMRHEVDIPATSEVAMYRLYYQDMPIYLDQRITIADWKGELEFGSQHEDVSAWMIDKDTFWKRWMDSGKVMFAVMRDDTYKDLTNTHTPESLHLYALDEEGRNLLFINVLPTSLKLAKPPHPPHH